MSSVVRPNRFKELRAEMEKKDAQLVEVRGALMRILTLQNQNDDLVYKAQQFEDALKKSHDQNRQVIAAFLMRVAPDGAPYEFSQSELEEAYRNAPRLATVEDDLPGQRFRLDLAIPQRDLTAGTPDTQAEAGTEEQADAAPELHAVPALDADKEPS
jgi:hypothetical protein